MNDKPEHAPRFRAQRERTQSGYTTEEMAKKNIAEKEAVLKNYIRIGVHEEGRQESLMKK